MRGGGSGLGAIAPVPRLSLSPVRMAGGGPVRRNMTPEEIAALWGQESQGLQPRLLPTTPLDVVENNPLFDYLGEVAGAVAESPALPAALLGLVRYKKPGVSAAARQAAEQVHRAPVTDPILKRDTLFHFTQPKLVDDILKGDEIVPQHSLQQGAGAKNWEEYKRMEEANPDLSEGKWYEKELRGTSLARNPRVSSKPTMAVGFAMDPQKVPRTTPFVEPGYGKTMDDEGAVNALWKEYQRSNAAVDKAFDRGDFDAAEGLQSATDDAFFRWQEAVSNPSRVMNPKFEYEQRTRDKAVPTSAIREIWADKAALQQVEGLNLEEYLDRLQGIASQRSLPLRVFETGREMHGARARMR